MAKLGPLILTLILALILSGCEQRSERPAAAQKKDAAQGIIVAAGDSLTAGLGGDEEEGYPAQLEKKMQAAGVDWRVINAGSSGETSSGLLSRLDWLLTLKPTIVILETGANDGLRGIDPTVTKNNIREAVRRLQGKNIVVILAGMMMVQNLGPEYTSAFNRIYPEIAKESGVLFMPFLLEGVAADPALNRGDAIHPTADGYRVVANNLYPYVLQAIAIVKKRPPAQHRSP